MKKSLLVLLGIALFPVSLYCYDEPMYFRDYRFNSHITAFSRSTLTLIEEEDGRKFYSKVNDKLNIGSADLSSIMYGFYNDIFYTVHLTFENSSNARKILMAMKEKYGEPTIRPNRFMEKFIWKGNDVSIYYEYKDILNTGNVVYLYMPVINRISNDEDKSAEDASNDF